MVISEQMIIVVVMLLWLGNRGSGYSVQRNSCRIKTFLDTNYDGKDVISSPIFTVRSKEYLVFLNLTKVSWLTKKRHQVFSKSFIAGFFPFWGEDPTEANGLQGTLVSVSYLGF